MERDITLNFEDIYGSIDDKDIKFTKKLLTEPLSTNDVKPIFCSYFCNRVFYYCCFFLSQ
jgi:hypothetical protein